MVSSNPASFLPLTQDLQAKELLIVLTHGESTGIEGTPKISLIHLNGA